MTGERAKELLLRPPLPSDVVQRIAMIDAEIQDLRNEMQALAKATRQGAGKAKVKNYTLGRTPSSAEVNAGYERQISSLMDERQRLMTSR